MAQLWKIRLPDGRVLVPGDWTSADPLFSVAEIPSGSFQVLTAFSYGIGGTVPGSIGQRTAFANDTNLEGEGGKIPENEELVAYNLNIECFQIGPASDSDATGLPVTDPPDVSLADMLRLQRDLVIITKIAAIKEYTKAPMGYFPAATGTWAFTSGARTTASAGLAGAIVSNNGGSSVQDRRTFASPLYAGPSDVFAVDIVPGPGQVVDLSVPDDGRIRLRLFFNGYRRRPVA